MSFKKVINLVVVPQNVWFKIQLLHHHYLYPEMYSMQWQLKDPIPEGTHSYIAVALSKYKLKDQLTDDKFVCSLAVVAILVAIDCSKKKNIIYQAIQITQNTSYAGEWDINLRRERPKSVPTQDTKS